MHYISIGAFHGDPGYDIKNTTYDWVRIRKYVEPEPAFNIQGYGPITIYRIVLRNPTSTETRVRAVYIMKPGTQTPLQAIENLDYTIPPREAETLVVTGSGEVHGKVQIVLVTDRGYRTTYNVELP